MNLYTPNPLLDSPFGPSDLEWLYRQQDVDGSTLTSRLSQLAPISFTNTIDGQRRRRLFALDSWEPNNFVWANDNPGGAFANNSRFALHRTSASLVQSGLNQRQVCRRPSLAHRDKKINLNYPLPVSNDPNEPVRQKWISDTYQPAQGGPAARRGRHRRRAGPAQPVRDQHHRLPRPRRHDDPLGQPGRRALHCPATVTHGGLPHAQLRLDQRSRAAATSTSTAWSTTRSRSMRRWPTRSRAGGNSADSDTTQTNRFFIELVNTLTAAYNPATTIRPRRQTRPITTIEPMPARVTWAGSTTPSGDPYSGGCWDLVFTADDPMSPSRPLPGRAGVIHPLRRLTTNYFGLIPLNRDSLRPPVVLTATSESQRRRISGDVTPAPRQPRPHQPRIIRFSVASCRRPIRTTSTDR